MDTNILGDGPLGQAIGAAFRERGTEARLLGRPQGGARNRTDLGTPGLTVEASRADAVGDNVAAALAAGCRRFVIATTGWESDRAAVDAELRTHGAAAVAAPNLSIGAALFFRLVERASELLGPIDGFEPYLLEWHRRSKRDRPSGTARELARRIAVASPSESELEIAVIRAGASPGMHLVGFDSPGETIELRLTARDRSAYAAGALAAADWLSRTTRSVGLHPFDAVVDELLEAPTLAATA
jgi:4-hydroxy-tetrahydrodipicolinate reductase